MCIITDNETGTNKVVSTREEVAKFMCIQTCKLLQVTAALIGITTEDIENIDEDSAMLLMNGRFTISRRQGA